MRSLKTTASRRKAGPGGRAGSAATRAATDGAESPDDSAPQRPAMKITEVLAELEGACKQVGVKLTYEAIGGELGSGGLCKVKGQWRAIFDKRTTPSERVGFLAPILVRFPLDAATLSEPVRELLSRVKPSPPESDSPPELDSSLAPDQASGGAGP